MKSIQALRERLNALAKETRKLVEDNNDKWSTDMQAKYDANMGEIEDIKGQIKRMEATNEQLADDKLDGEIRETLARRAGGGGDPKAREKHSEIFARYLRHGPTAITTEEWREIRATMSTGTGNQGGYSVQTDVATDVIDSLKAFGGMRAVATILKMASGNPMSFPSSDGTGETGELVGENTVATGLDPSFGTVPMNVYKFSSKIVAVPWELLQDSQVDIIAFVKRRLAQRLGRTTNTYYTTGNGTGQPNGLMNATTLGKAGTTGQTTTVIFDDLVDLVHSVDPAYRALPGVGFAMHDLSLRTIRKIKDSQNRPIFLPGYDGLAGKMADTLLGYDVNVNQDIAQMAANAKSIAFGALSEYYIRDVMEVTMFRFDDSAYASKGQVGFLAWMRSGGNLLDTAAVKHYANSAT